MYDNAACNSQEGRPLHPGNNESLFMPLGRLRELEEGVKPCNVGVRSAITAWHAVGKQRSKAITLLSISSLCRSGRPSLAPSLPCTQQASVNYSSGLLCEVLLRHSAKLQHLLHDVQKPCATSIRKKASHEQILKCGVFHVRHVHTSHSDKTSTGSNIN